MEERKEVYVRAELVQQMPVTGTFPGVYDFMYNPDYLEDMERKLVKGNSVMWDENGKVRPYVLETYVDDTGCVEDLFTVKQWPDMCFRVLVFESREDKRRYLALRDGKSAMDLDLLKYRIKSGRWRKG